MTQRPCLPLIVLMVCTLAAFTTRANIALTNYTAAHPLKILPGGDSITDDSAVNGAWRAPLQKLLVTNSYAFTNLGRNTSAAVTGFTQLHHEGMDGAVIAAPGVSGPTHGYALTNNYALLTLSNALATLTPDIVLIDLGVNDMGHGRNPYLVATNHVPALLDMIFAKVPSAHIIISKPTTITYSTILSPPYLTYKTNMYIFCDQLQAVAAARRAQGQNVFVADLFSAVYGQSMFGDGTHPNSAGLAALANEMMFRIATITTRPDYTITPFILAGSVWKYSDQGLDLSTNWSQPDFDDSTWSQGAGRLGYNVIGQTTTIGYGGNSANKYITTYFRRAFVAPNNVAYTNLNLRVNRADGAVVWLNGNEIYRVNMQAGAINSQTLSTTSVNTTNDDSNTYFQTNLPIASLPPGTNVIAVEIHKSSASANGLTFDLELFGKGTNIPPPTLTFTSASGALQLAWPTNYSNFALQTISAFSSNNIWQLIASPYPQTNNLFTVTIPIAADATQFFRLVAPTQ